MWGVSMASPWSGADCRTAVGGSVVALHSGVRVVWPAVAGCCTPQDPQQALVVSLARWHMRWFLALAQRAHLRMESYSDTPVGLLEVHADQPPTLVRVVLSPAIRCTGAQQPGAEQIMAIHAAARAQCALSNGIDIVVRNPYLPSARNPGMAPWLSH